MTTCRDCGHKNIGAIYCTRCGSALYSKQGERRPSEPYELSLKKLLGSALFLR